MGDISIFDRRENPKTKKVTIGILLDQSGSMCGDRMKKAREVVIVLVESLKGLKGIDLVVYGHTGDVERTHDLNMLPYIDRAGGHNNLSHLATAPALQENLDGFALRFVANQMAKNNHINPDSIHHLFLITDGVPYGRDYGTSVGARHTITVCQQISKRKQNLCVIGIDNAFEEAYGKSVFGDNVIVIGDVQSSLDIIVRKIRKIFK